MAPHASGSVEAELAKERTFGGDGVDVERDMRVIDLSDPSELMHLSTSSGAKAHDTD